MEVSFVNRRHVWMLGSLEVRGTKAPGNARRCRLLLESGDNPRNRDNQQPTRLRLGGSTLGKTWVLRCLRYGLLPLETVFTCTASSMPETWRPETRSGNSTHRSV